MSTTDTTDDTVAVCPHCGSRNTNGLTDTQQECYDCGKTYDTPANKLKRWKLDAGNSNTGPCGFVMYDIMAATAEDALAFVREELPNSLETKLHDGFGNETLTVVSYFNADHLTLDNIEEDEDEDDHSQDDKGEARHDS
jgi:hypothetical protein